jgi:hypothetical protein
MVCDIEKMTAKPAAPADAIVSLLTGGRTPRGPRVLPRVFKTMSAQGGKRRLGKMYQTHPATQLTSATMRPKRDSQHAADTSSCPPAPNFT